MKKFSKSSDTDLQDIDLLLELSAAGTKLENTQNLQAQIVSATSEMAQFTRQEKPTVAGYVAKVSTWFSLSNLAGASALVFALVLTINLWPLEPGVATPSAQQLVQNTQSTQAEGEFDFSVLSAQEAQMDAYDDLVWDELLLAEDELAFAML